MATAFDKGLVDAAKRGDTVGVMKALRGGVDADSLPSQWSSESDMRALHYAAYSNAADVAKLLLDAGADANRKQGVRTFLETDKRQCDMRHGCLHSFEDIEKFISRVCV